MTHVWDFEKSAKIPLRINTGIGKSPLLMVGYGNENEEIHHIYKGITWQRI